MKTVFKILLILFTFSIISCKNDKNEVVSKNIENENIVEAQKDLSQEMNQDLLGTWTRVTYPFSVIEFKETHVRFIEGEGNVDPPVFEPYALSENCPFGAVKLGAPINTLFLIRQKNSLCEVIRIENDTLKLSNSKMDYTIPYVRK